MNIKTFAIYIFIIILISCNQTEKKQAEIFNQSDVIINFINPPLKNVDVSFTEYNVDAAKGDTIFYQSGSIILFPPNAFVDKNGNVIEGNIQIKYREFSNAVDLYLSGIPMNYDSAGKKYNFESAGMCEINAYKDGTPVYVNPKSKPEINLAGNNNSDSFSLYYLDTTKKNWVNKGASVAVNLNDLKKENKTIAIKPGNKNEEPIEPVKLEKANNKSPIIQLVIDPASFKELLVYDNLRFQVDGNQNVNTSDTAEEWSNVELEKGKSNGLYILKFTNAKKTVFYAARPVLEGKDYDKALAIFEKNNEKYKKKLNERIAKENARKENYQKEFLKDSLDNIKLLAEKDRIDKLNILIEKRNKEIEKDNIEILKDNKIIEKQIAIQAALKKKLDKLIKEKAADDSIRMATQAIEFEKMQEEQEERFKESQGFDTIIRNFSIDGFGVWNCDRFMKPFPLLITANFEDSAGMNLFLSNITVLYKSPNALRTFLNNQIEVNATGDHMILGTDGGRLTYISFPDYKKMNIKPGTKTQTFIMTIVPEENNNYEYIKTLLQQQQKDLSPINQYREWKRQNSN